MALKLCNQSGVLIFYEKDVEGLAIQGWRGFTAKPGYKRSFSCLSHFRYSASCHKYFFNNILYPAINLI